VENESLKNSRVEWMTNVDRARLLHTVLSVLPQDHQLRVLIESIFTRIAILAVRLDMPATPEQKSAFLAEGDILDADLRRAAIEAYRFVQ
jgi:hypothetical protein